MGIINRGGVVNHGGHVTISGRAIGTQGKSSKDDSDSTEGGNTGVQGTGITVTNSTVNGEYIEHREY